jgi:putative oxidoreductase
MKKVALIARLLLGLMFTVFGANGLMMVFTGKGFIPMPPQPAVMVTIMTGFAAAKYMLPLVFFCQFLAGVFLLSGFFVNAGLVLLGPVLVNILGIHLAVEPSGLPMALVVLVLYLTVLSSRWNDFRQLVKMK